MRKRIVIFLFACTLNPFLIDGRGGVGAGFLGMGLGMAIGSARNRDPEVIYVKQQAPNQAIDDDTQDYEDQELDKDQELNQNQKTNGVMYEQV